MVCVSEIGNVVFSQIGLSSYSQSFFLFCSTCAENLRAGRISSRNIFTHTICMKMTVQGQTKQPRDYLSLQHSANASDMTGPPGRCMRTAHGCRGTGRLRRGAVARAALLSLRIRRRCLLNRVHWRCKLLSEERAQVPQVPNPQQQNRKVTEVTEVTPSYAPPMKPTPACQRHTSPNKRTSKHARNQHTTAHTKRKHTSTQARHRHSTSTKRHNSTARRHNRNARHT